MLPPRHACEPWTMRPRCLLEAAGSHTCMHGMHLSQSNYEHIRRPAVPWLAPVGSKPRQLQLSTPYRCLRRNGIAIHLAIKRMLPFFPHMAFFYDGRHHSFWSGSNSLLTNIKVIFIRIQITFIKILVFTVFLIFFFKLVVPIVVYLSHCLIAADST